ncbi:uncharacterized protein L201_006717 [Kwoniella dendrophila CBS 6074]|uniref:Uncharacterized protein n=1 Tax=Kwoniella dendrophila CBS 6074 TaxID=1295534 RepID=A0AAX4K4S2_9TREE
MPITFLDLTDEIIQLVGHFVNPDNSLPIPSFTPHWENCATVINPHISKDLIAFRETCTGIRTICKLEGLHLETGYWTEVQAYLINDRWNNHLKAVSRARISISSLKDETDVVSCWMAFTSLLMKMPNLEELISDEVPFCVHSAAVWTTEELRLPPWPILNNLTSLSIHPICHKCASIIPLLIIPAALKLQHLRHGVVKPDKDNMIADSRDTSEDLFRHIKNAWCKRQSKSEMPLKTLHLGSPSRKVSFDILYIMRSETYVEPGHR